MHSGLPKFLGPHERFHVFFADPFPILHSIISLLFLSFEQIMLLGSDSLFITRQFSDRSIWGFPLCFYLSPCPFICSKKKGFFPSCQTKHPRCALFSISCFPLAHLFLLPFATSGSPTQQDYFHCQKSCTSIPLCQKDSNNFLCFCLSFSKPSKLKEYTHFLNFSLSSPLTFYDLQGFTQKIFCACPAPGTW